jgi:hypothetical protein
MEQGEYRVPLDTLFRILQTFEISLGEFFGDLVSEQHPLTSREASLLHLFRELSPSAQDDVYDFVEFKRAREQGPGG